MDPRKPIFDSVRAAAPEGLFNDPGNVLALDNLLDAFGVARPDGGRLVSAEGIALVKRFEGCKLTAYPDPGTGGQPWTIGWGATTINGRPVRKGETISQAQADALLVHGLRRYADQVSEAIGNAPTSQRQFDALVSFHYNTGKIADATLTRFHKAGNFALAAGEFGRWVHAGGKVMAGLVRRRAAEAALYRSGS